MSDEIKSFIAWWNLNYPLDKWYRDKFNIPFNSRIHRETSIVEIRIQYEEYVLYSNIRRSESIEYNPGRGDWLKPIVYKELTQQEIDYEFENLNLDEFNS